MTNDVCCNSGIVGVELPKEGDGIKYVIRLGEGVRSWRAALEVFFGDSVEDGVAPCLPFLTPAAWGADVS